MLDSIKDAELIKRIETTQGIRPTPAPVPPPGVYWLKTTCCYFYWVDKTGTRLDHSTHNEIWPIYTWDLQEESNWVLAEVERGHWTMIGSDESSNWEREHELVTRVGPRVEQPGEEKMMNITEQLYTFTCWKCGTSVDATLPQMWDHGWARHFDVR